MATLQQTVSELVTLSVRSCPTCGAVFAIPAVWVEQLRKEGGTFYCPNGHSLVFPKDTEVDRLKKDLAAEKQRADYHARQAEYERRAHAATKGQMTRLKNRAARGVCPCCNRSFASTRIAQHIKTKHPEYAKEVF